jgi:hypothetical protein
MNLIKADNSLQKVQFRQDIMTIQNGLEEMIKDGVIESTLEDCKVKHYFSPKDEKYGCCTYAREMFIPKGTLIIGKIHRHQHLNIISKGKVVVYTEFGEKHMEGPITFVSEIGLKRSVYAIEDTLWTTIHMTEFVGEENLDKIEQEVIAPTYDEMGLIASIDDLAKIENKGTQL